MRVFNRHFISKFVYVGPKTDGLHSWKKFHRAVRSQGPVLLKELHRFPNSILVAGCQRSGTTMLARVLTESEGMFNYWFGLDDELDAAQILSGYVHRECEGRYCFQTTYLNESYPEYYERENDFKLIWVLRNPASVVYSMLYNWGRFAFNELFDGVGVTALNEDQQAAVARKGRRAISKLEQACLSYNAKTSQIFSIRQHLGEERVMVVEYDELAMHKDKLLPKIYDFVELEYNTAYLDKIHAGSVTKLDKLTNDQKQYIIDRCTPVYDQVKALTVS